MTAIRHPATYLFHGRDGEVIYVGSSINPLARLGSHAGHQDWWPDVTSIEVRHFVTLAEARKHEVECIAAINPRYNVNGRTDLPKEKRVYWSVRKGDPWDKFPGHRKLLMNLREAVLYTPLTNMDVAESLGFTMHQWSCLGTRPEGIHGFAIERARIQFPDLVPECLRAPTADAARVLVVAV